MVDITAKLFWYRTKEWYRIMADKVDDLVYTDENKETINVINLLLLGWILLGLIVYIIGNVVIAHLKKRKSTLAAHKSDSADNNSETNEHVFRTADIETKTEAAVQDIQQTKVFSNIPICEGEDSEIVEWINNVFFWIYNHRVVSPILDSWLSSLNANTRLSSTEHGILVDFKDVARSSNTPNVTNVLQSYNSKGDTIINCDTEIKDIVFDVIVTQFKENEKEIHPFKLNVHRIAGKVNIECIPEDPCFNVKYSEVPQIQLSVEAAESSAVPSEDVEALKDVVHEISSEALSSAPLNLRLACFPECPRLLPKYLSENTIESSEKTDEKQLLVKIIKASNLGGDQGCLKPYCVVEMDEPPQRFETQTVEERFNPFWDESYTFIVKDISAELLFEIYDKGKPSNENFLGLGIVSVDELLKNPSQRQIIPLQSRPLENDNVTGTLTSEFLFLNQSSPVSDTTHLSQFVSKTESPGEEDGKSVETNCRVTSAGTVITTTTIKRTKEGSSDTAGAISKLHANSKCSADEYNLTPLDDVVETFVREKNIKNALKPHFPNDTKISNGVVKVINQMNFSCDNNHVSSDIFTKKDLETPNINNQTSNGSVKTITVSNDSEISKDNGQISNGQIFNYEVNISNGNNQFSDGVLNERETDDVSKKISINHENSISESDEKLSNTAILSEAESINSDFISTSSVEEKNISEDKEHLGFNDLPKAACPSSPHVHDIPVIVPKLPIIVIGDSYENVVGNGSACKEGQNAAPTEFIALHGGSSVSREDDSDREIVDTDEVCTDLPPIAELVEFSSTSPEDLEIDDAETDLTGAALKEIEKLSKPNATSKSTLIIHSVQRPDNPLSESLEASPASHVSKDSKSESVSSSPIQDSTNRSRPKEKKSFMGNLKRKLSFHKTRSKSAENRSEAVQSYSQASSRSASTDRIRHTTPKHSPFKERLLGQFLNTPGSTRSSLSEASGVSGLSTRTYVNENSTLVVETNENGIIKRYLIPNSLIHQSKWKKRGLKLHIYNDHVFIAKHLSGSIVCQVCEKHLTRRPGKQGYECRGCNLQCHKSCHVKVEDFCSNSSVNSMEVEYVHDPKGASPKSI